MSVVCGAAHPKGDADMRRHKFEYAHTLVWRGIRSKICGVCGNYPQADIHRVRGWRSRL